MKIKNSLYGNSLLIYIYETSEIKLHFINKRNLKSVVIMMQKKLQFIKKIIE